MDWSLFYPHYFNQDTNILEEETSLPKVEFADIGCGYGGLLGKAGVLRSTVTYRLTIICVNVD